MSRMTKAKRTINRPEGEENSFFERVYTVVRQVPHGRVTTFGAIARFLGTGRSARMVGWALNNCHTSWPPVPAQRVVNRMGLLSGKQHFPTPTLMEELLESEGVEVKENCVVRFNELFWDPGNH
jgi:methylated-DNA-protein-cysteine methyltransferase-like protein